MPHRLIAVLVEMPGVGTWLVQCANLNDTERMTSRNAELFQKAALAAGAERILICGSLYLAGKVLAMNEEVPD